MLKGKQKRQLRSLAHHLSPIFQVGKSGVTSEMIQGIRDALEKRELIKVSILQNCEEDKDVVAELLSERTSSELVHSLLDSSTISSIVFILLLYHFYIITNTHSLIHIER